MGRTRHRIRCAGVVQGVGFRPAVWRLASALDLGGWVRNDGVGVTVEVEGDAAVVARFADRLLESLPPLARVERLDREEVPPRSELEFSIRDSEGASEGGSPIPPDSALCAACAAEVADPDDRRHRYAFTTCTDCGPRFTVALGLPYDRERTSLRAFPLCPECAAEYADPTSRRFHAESICCPSCGPRLRLATSDGRALAEGGDAASGAREALALGRIVAVKGLGGFQLACRADREETVALLRERKRRPHKPLAVMARDLVTARRLVRLRPDDEALLTGPRSPILLAGARADSPVAPGVAPGLDELGVMLPTTPLHAELFRGAVGYDVLVMTSGNASEEPICRTDDEALERLGAIADLFLLHDREVVRRVDDSVVRSSGSQYLVVRRSRGYVPGTLPLPEPCPEPVLALGGYLQTTACVASGAEAIPSQHVGDLDTESARGFLREVAEGLEAFVDRRSSVLVADLHPDYPSGWLADVLAGERGARVLRVQHHLAHAAAVLAESGRFPSRGERAAALVLDGTGYGPDGVAWGCEWLVLDGDLRWSRVARGASLPLVGGERAVLEPWRVATGALAEAGEEALLDRTPLAGEAGPGTSNLHAVASLAVRRAWPRATGAGRVFEAAGALLGVGATNGWEGGSAARLEALAFRSPVPGTVWSEVALDEPGELPTRDLLVALASRVAHGEDRARLAADFHATFAALAVRLTERALPTGVRCIALGGGCLVNRLLFERLVDGLRSIELEPLTARELPCGDGGLAYGQAVLAALTLSRGTPPRLEGATRCASPSR